ncbi:MAG: SDR family oxidoreductase [Gemmatimonadaceae bacterium]
MTFTSPRVLVLGATGMLGHTVMRFLAEDTTLSVVGSARSASSARLLPESLSNRIVTGVEVENVDSLNAIFAATRPDVVVNCVGLVKQLESAADPLVALPINAVFPHRLSRLCDVANARLIHVSTDCVFSGARGMYTESDPSDANDLYGRSKYLGEVDHPHAITLRTSIIGHELAGAQGLVEWFLAQTSPIRGYSRAIFSGLPTVELARVIRDHVMPHPQLHGVYHVAAAPIAKLDLLTLVANAYDRSTTITPDPSLQIDRSLNGDRFQASTGYVAPAWPELVRRMRDFH